MLPYAFIWEKCSEFQITSPLEPLGQICSNFILSLLRLGEQKIAKMVAVHSPRWPPCPYMVKTFKNLLLQNPGCFGAESLHNSSGTEGLPKLLKFDLFTARSFASLCIYMGKKHLKMLFSKIEDGMWLNVCIYHRERAVYQGC